MKKNRKKKKGWGGDRSGAGRPGPSVRRVHVNAWIPEPMRDAMVGEAQQRSVSLMHILREAILLGRSDLYCDDELYGIARNILAGDYNPHIKHVASAIVSLYERAEEERAQDAE